MSIAEEAVALGLPVFPCLADKKPACPHGFKDAQSKPDRIRALWRDHWGPFIGVPTGSASGFVVVDIDPQGLPWMRARLRKRRLPDTRIHQTPRGGYHFLYRTPNYDLRNSSSKLAFAIDIRGEGGYVVHPPSAGYLIANESDLARFPGWIKAALEKIDAKAFAQEQKGFDPTDANALERFILNSHVGERNSRVFWAACRIGEPGGNTAHEARLIAAAMAIGLDKKEAESTIQSGIKRGRSDGKRKQS